MKAARVGLARAENRRENVYQSLDLIRRDIEPKLAAQVMLKPNFLSSENQLASTHPDAIRGAIDFLLSASRPPDEIIIAEGGNEKRSGEAFENFGYKALQDEYEVPIRLVDLNQETQWEETSIHMAGGVETVVRMPKIVLECPCTISVAVAKTHDVCVVTLAQKNMIMGTIHKEDRIKMHGYPSHAQRILPSALDEPDGSFATMYRDRRYKLVVYHGHDLGELYDLEEDPNEFENMWDEPEAQPLKLELMQKSFDASMLAMDRGPKRVGPM